MPYELV
jgi:hypothetical protein